VRFAALFVLLAFPSVGSAQSDLERARAAFDRADFEEAVAAYDAATRGDGLSRADVIALLEGRAIARHASRDVAGAEADLSALLSLDPERPLGEAAPPALQRAFGRLRGEVRGTLSVASEATAIPDGFAVNVRVTDDVASLVREVRVRWEHQGAWRTEVGREVRVPSGAHLRYYVEAIGPGGAVIASDGSAGDPHTSGTPIVVPNEPRAVISRGDDTGLHVGLTIGIGVVLAAVAVVLAVVLTMPARTQPSAPMELP
jgi:hypothetical protein